MRPFSLKSALMVTVSSAALTLTLPHMALAQKTVEPTGQAQAQAPQLSQELQKLREARSNIEVAQPDGMSQAIQEATQALKQIDQRLESMQDEASQNARQSVDEAEQALSASQPVPQEISLALRKVETAVEGVEQSTASNQSGGSVGSGGNVKVEQKSAKLTVQQNQPKVAVQQPAPQVTIEQPEPTVKIEQPKPKVVVEQAKPKVEADCPGLCKVCGIDLTEAIAHSHADDEIDPRLASLAGIRERLQ